MKARTRPLNTIAAWFSLHILFAVGVAVLLNALVLVSLRVWSNPDLMEGGLAAQIGIITNVLETTHVPQRESVAASASTAHFRVRWFADPVPTPLPAIATSDEGVQAALESILGRHVEVRVFDPHDGNGVRPVQNNYVLGVQLRDQSWVVLDTPERIWGVGRAARWSAMALFVLVSSVLVALLAGRRLARPIRALALAAERFGTQMHAPPLAPEGPVELRITMNAFNAMQERIERFVRDRTEMLAAISHDLRSPLTRMKLRGVFIEDKDLRARLGADMDEMQAMVNAALGFFEEDSIDEPGTTFDLAGLVCTVLDDARDAGGEATFEGPDRLIVHGRPHALKRALVNLVDNAIKYGDRADVTVLPGANEVRLQVADRGPGIPPAILDDIFRPFFRGEASRNKATGGFGLGLGTARSIVRAHGGDLSLSMRDGGGTVALVVLPRVAALP